MQIKVLKATEDDWHGSYVLKDSFEGVKNQMFVEVSFLGNITAYDPKLTPVWRTCVWGNDDLGMEFDCSTEAECFNKFLQVIGMKFVNRVALKELGFISA